MARTPNKPFTKFESFDALFTQAEQRPGYWLEGAILGFTDAVLRRMEAVGMTRAELAASLGSSSPQVTRLLSGRNNFTLSTMVAIARVLGCELRLSLKAQANAVLAGKTSSKPTKAAPMLAPVHRLKKKPRELPKPRTRIMVGAR